MSRQLHIGAQSAYSQFAPDSELPLANRIITKIPCRTARPQGSYGTVGVPDVAGDFESPLNFSFSMNNGLMFLRSCILRLPIAARFRDPVGNAIKDDSEIAQIGIRNRPVKCFRKIDSIVNGFTSTHLPEDLEYINEYLFTDDEFTNNLPNEGSCVPVCKPLSHTRREQRRDQYFGESVRGRRYNPDVQENPNFVERCKRFRKDYNKSTQYYEGDIEIPVECGPFRPYSSKRAVRTKFVPYIGTAQFQYEWQNYQPIDSWAQSGIAARAVEGDHQTNVAKYLFEKCNAQAEAASGQGKIEVDDVRSSYLMVSTDPYRPNAFLVMGHNGNRPQGPTTDNVPTRYGFQDHYQVRDANPSGTSYKWDVKHAVESVGLTEAFWDQPWVVGDVQDATGVAGGAYYQVAIGGVTGANNTGGIAMDFGYSAENQVANVPNDHGQGGYFRRVATAFRDAYAGYTAANTQNVSTAAQHAAQPGSGNGSAVMRTLVLNPASIIHFRKLQRSQAAENALAGANAATNLQPIVFCIFAQYHPGFTTGGVHYPAHPDVSKRGTIFRVHVATGAAFTHMHAVNVHGYNSAAEQQLRAAANGWYTANFGVTFGNWWGAQGHQFLGGAGFRLCSNRSAASAGAFTQNVALVGNWTAGPAHRLFYRKTVPGISEQLTQHATITQNHPNEFLANAASRSFISSVELFWRRQPELICEWAVLQRTEPTYRLFYPQYQFYRGYGTDGDSMRFQLPSNGNEVQQFVSGIKLNEVPNQIILYCQIHEEVRNGFEWLDLKPLISNVKLSINERPDLTSDVPLYLGYRWFVENTGSTMTREEWEASNFWVISPQQLGITPQTFTESMARVSSLDIRATVKQSRSLRAMEDNLDTGAYPYTQSAVNTTNFKTPMYTFKVIFCYTNHSLLINSKREMLLVKNTIAAPGPSGLIKEDRFLPRSSGLGAMG